MGVTTLPFDLAIFLRSGSRIQPEMAASRPGQRVELQMGPHHRGEQPGPDDVVAPGAAGPSGTDPANRSGSSSHSPGDLRGQRRRGPGVHHVGIGHEAARRPRCGLGVADGRVGGRVDRAGGLVGPSRVVIVGLPVLVEAVPHRERTPKKRWRLISQSAVEALDPCAYRTGM